MYVGKVYVGVRRLTGGLSQEYTRNMPDTDEQTPPTIPPTNGQPAPIIPPQAPIIKPIPSIPKPIIDNNKPAATQPQPPKEERLLPLVQYPPALWDKTQNLIKEIEQKIQSKVITYFTHTSVSITDEDVDYFFSHVRDLQPESSIALILISYGGSGTAGWRIANVLRNYCQNFSVIVPSRCASAATMMSLSADKILLGPAGYLTAIDTSLTHPLNPRPSEKERAVPVSVDQINRAKEFILEDLKNHPGGKSLSEILFEKIHPLVFGELQRTSSLSKMIAKNMMSLRKEPPTEEEQNRIANLLNDSYPTHGYPIVLKEARQIGLPAEPTPPELNPLLWELVKLYSLASKPAITDFAPTFFHNEHVQVMIESVNKRTFLKLSCNRRFVTPPGPGWVTENDKTRWLSALPDPENPDKPKISEIEL